MGFELRCVQTNHFKASHPFIVSYSLRSPQRFDDEPYLVRLLLEFGRLVGKRVQDETAAFERYQRDHL